MADTYAIIHAGSATTLLTKARSIDVVGTRRLLKVAREADVSHVVYVSIVGMEGVDYPSKRGSSRPRRIVQENIVPWSILRATQFHTLMETLLEAFSRPPFVAAVAVKWRFQPVAASEVAALLVQVAAERHAGRLPDFGVPEARVQERPSHGLKARRLNKRLIALPVPFKFSRQFAAGCLLAPGHLYGKITFEQYLAEKDPT